MVPSRALRRSSRAARWGEHAAWCPIWEAGQGQASAGRVVPHRHRFGRGRLVPLSAASPGTVVEQGQAHTY